MDTTLYMLTGPTAVGKTELALQWAERHDAEILSCDSTLFYTGMGIGTAKPTAAERARVPHHGIDLVSVSQSFDIDQYIAYAQSAINQIHQRGKRVLITGGSGFYLKAFLAPVVDGIEVPQDVTNRVGEVYAEHGVQGLIELMLPLNPDGFGDLALENPRRVLKAAERCLATQKSYINLNAEFKNRPCAFNKYTTKTCLLQRDEDSLKSRIALRAESMLENGLIEEVRHLIAQGLAANANSPQARAIGYREVIEYLKSNSQDTEALLKEIVQNTNRLVAKQRKWFRHQIQFDQILHIEPNHAPEALLEELFPD